MDAKDPDGKLFIEERRDIALKHASFWQEYKFMYSAIQKFEEKDMH